MFKDAGLSSGYLWGPQSQPNTAHSLVPTSEEFPYLQHEPVARSITEGTPSPRRQARRAMFCEHLRGTRKWGEWFRNQTAGS